MGHIFLSYSRQDADLMRKVRDNLDRNRFDVWTDETLIPGTPSWMDAIQEAIDNAICLVVILSPDAKKSKWVKEEMRYADAQNVRIFPLLARGSERDSIPFGFITAQHVNVSSYTDLDTSIHVLTDAIRDHLGAENNAHQKPETSTKAPSLEIETKGLPLEVAKAVEIIQDPMAKWWRQVDAINKLGEIGDEKAIGILEELLNNPDIDLRYAAQNALNTHRGTQPEAEPGAASQPQPPQPAAPSKPTQTVKIVITGPFSSGKTEFISAISEIAVVSTERQIAQDTQERQEKEVTTVAMDFGRITVDEELVLYLFGTPGQRRFDFMWEILAEGMLGFVVMVDSAKPETFREAKSILETFRAYAPTPYVVAANKQDHPDAWDVADMRIALRIDEGVRLVPCVAKDIGSVRNVLLELLYSILESLES